MGSPQIPVLSPGLHQFVHLLFVLKYTLNVGGHFDVMSSMRQVVFMGTKQCFNQSCASLKSSLALPPVACTPFGAASGWAGCLSFVSPEPRAGRVPAGHLSRGLLVVAVRIGTQGSHSDWPTGESRSQNVRAGTEL